MARTGDSGAEATTSGATGDVQGPVAARIASLLPSLLPAERQVAQILLDQQRGAVDLSSQQIAELAGVSRATVVRACRSLGYRGWAQVRVLMARDGALAGAEVTTTVPGGEAPGPAAVLGRFTQLAEAATAMTAMLKPADIEAAVETLAGAGRVLVVGHGLSRSLAVDAEARLVRLGVITEFHSDRIQERIAARRLGPGDAVLVLSGSGANTDALATASAAAETGARLVAVTAFARSPLAELATHPLVVCKPGQGFAEELTDTTRVPEQVLLEGLVAALRYRLGERAAVAGRVALQEVSRLVQE